MLHTIKAAIGWHTLIDSVICIIDTQDYRLAVLLPTYWDHTLHTPVCFVNEVVSHEALVGLSLSNCT